MTLLAPESTLDTEQTADGLLHLWCRACYPEDPVRIGGVAFCGVRKITRDAGAPAGVPDCPLCDAVEDQPCPRCGL